jgi:putative transposase
MNQHNKIIYKSFKYRLYPNRIQKHLLEKALETCRGIYNSALDHRNTIFKSENRTITYFEQCKLFNIHSNAEYENIHSNVIQDTLRRLDKAFRNFYNRNKRKKAGENLKVGLPRFKNPRRFNSFCYPQTGFKLSGSKIYLSKIGTINFKYSRPTEGKIKTCQVVRSIDQWYVVLTCEKTMQTELFSNKLGVGVDFGLESYLTLSNGVVIKKPRFDKMFARKLKVLRKQFGRKITWSKNKGKNADKIAKISRRITRKRLDLIHKVTRNISKTYGIVVLEDLCVPNMLRNEKLRRSIDDAAWIKCISIMKYKAEEAGIRMILIDPSDTSSKCSSCGNQSKKNLSDRLHKCQKCGLVLKRDLNAAINIYTAGTAGL